jgi:beta-lactamase regulating signal transducer with metallopeptidase domain
MKTKDTIAVWLLVFFVLVPFGKTLYASQDAFRSHRPISTILWYFGLNLVVAVCGLFVLVRFVTITQDLNRHEAEERQREKDLHPESSE